MMAITLSFLYLNKHHKLGGSAIATNIGKRKITISTIG
ncbi:hypothetical protein M107_1534 [Bacteroides fragilis str. 3725 D9(v)]|uniref:Uncharacterized protein n=2 Tax=Bacteroides fragilis TaxID=817 RepID=A0A015V607_BACFG|nr:hypothetical protein M125_2462 [Bacteroides fragilis str. 3998T(B)3]EXY95736.1 hypothetical protein M081_2121 [Bacteroides fragilis str. 3998 T(B) 4]EXZ28701.1 hypothetical protein M136_2018 [Bacteroides fragilis str. S36L11]EXZ63974.1 hypothetical protein M107_1534 [Bacteroides fragilis str. 3725 D9(v)]EYA85618.1 hypothetical protein M137_2546 [Bacteroides fragilis str. S36L12]EYA91092.1 hypothetical protein M135_2307 [Bacteroides fragilis str. S36L5]